MTEHDFQLVGIYADTIADGQELGFTLPDIGALKVNFKAREDKRNEITFEASGFTDSGGALNAGTALKQIASLMAMELGVGIDFGDDKAMEDNKTLEGKMPGLYVHPKGIGRGKLHLFRPVSKTPKAASIEDSLKRCQQVLRQTKAAKLQLAAALYSRAHFSASQEARLVTLVTALETLATRGDQSAPVATFIDTVNERLEADAGITPEERHQLASALGDLKLQSISESCRRVGAQYGGLAGLAIADRSYKVRSKLVHDGRQSLETNLDSLCGDVDHLLRQVVAGLTTQSS